MGRNTSFTLSKLNATGTLSIQEFRVLWKRLLFYLEVFQKRDTNRSGKLDLVELHAAVEKTEAFRSLTRDGKGIYLLESEAQLAETKIKSLDSTKDSSMAAQTGSLEKINYPPH